MWACIAHCFHSLLGCWSSNGSAPPRRRLGPTWGSTSMIQRPVWETPGSEWETANPLCCLREPTRITDSSESDRSFLIGSQPRIYGWINNSCHDVTLVDCRHRRPQQTWECCSCVCKDSQNVFYRFIICFRLSRWHNFLKRLFLYSWSVRRVLWPLTATTMLASRWQNMPIFHCTCFHNGWGRNSVRSALREYGRERDDLHFSSWPTSERQVLFLCLCGLALLLFLMLLHLAIFSFVPWLSPPKHMFPGV